MKNSQKDRLLILLLSLSCYGAAASAGQGWNIIFLMIGMFLNGMLLGDEPEE